MRSSQSIPVRLKVPDGLSPEQYLKILKQVALDSDMTLGELSTASLMHVPAIANKVIKAQSEALERVK